MNLNGKAIVSDDPIVKKPNGKDAVSSAVLDQTTGKNAVSSAKVHKVMPAVSSAVPIQPSGKTAVSSVKVDTRPFPSLLAPVVVPVRSSRVSAILGNPRGRRTDWIGHAPSLSREASLSQSREQALRLLASALLDSTQAALSQHPKVGTTEADIIVDQVTSQDIVDDPEIGKDEVIDVKDKELNKQKLRRRIDQYKHIPGAVRDINITLNDQAWTAQHIMINIQINSSTTVSLSVFDAQAGQLRTKDLGLRLSSKPEKDTTSEAVPWCKEARICFTRGVEQLCSGVTPTKPRSRHWKLQTDGVTYPVLNAPRSSSEGILRSHALRINAGAVGIFMTQEDDKA
ncbi:hypothetical protein Bca101_080346 [Brassica carinata]